MEQASQKNALSVVTRRLTRYTVIWTIIVIAASVAIIQDRVEAHRHEQIQAGQHRLDSLHESLGVTFQQLTALPAPWDGSHVVDFLAHSNDSSSSMPDNERKAFDRPVHPG